MASDDLFAASTSSLSFERFIGTINQPAARDLVKDINLCVRGRRERSINQICGSWRNCMEGPP